MIRTLTALLLSLCLCASLKASPPRYSVTDIGQAPSGQIVFINNHGQVAAFYFTGQIITAGDQGLPGFLWVRGKRTSLRLPPAYNSTIVCGINNHGQIAGNLDATFDGPLTIVSHAFLWQHGTTRDLGAPDGDQVSEARAINDKGVIVGRAYASGRPVEDDSRLTEHHAFVHRNGQFTDLGVGEANAINNKGQIVGETPGSVYVDATLWDKGKVFKLGTHGQAVAINDSGQIIIQVSTAQSVLWHKGHMLNLLPLPGCDQAQAAAINAQGWVIGTTTDRQNSRAALWRNGKVFDLNALISSQSGWVLLTATSINDQGQIVGMGKRNGQDHLFLLTPWIK